MRRSILVAHGGPREQCSSSPSFVGESLVISLSRQSLQHVSGRDVNASSLRYRGAHVPTAHRTTSFLAAAVPASKARILRCP